MINEETFAAEIEGAGETTPLDKARAALNGLAAKVADDPKIAFSFEIIEALRYLHEHSKGEYEEHIHTLKGCGVRVRSVEEEVKRTRRQLRAVEAGEDGRKLACDFLPDAPLRDLIIPAGYRLADGITWGPGVWGDEAIAYGHVLLTGRTRDIDSEGVGVRLSWSNSHGGWQHRVVSRGTVADARSLVGLSEYGYPVTSSDAKGQVEFFAQLEHANNGSLPTARTTSHLGWQGKHGSAGILIGREFLTPDGQSQRAELNADSMAWGQGIAFRGHGPGDEQLAEGYYREGTLAAWIEAVAQVQRFPRVLAAIYAAFVPPLLAILDCPNWILDLSSRTSQGKTTTLRAAASVWGCPDERQPAAAIQTWDVTRVFVERASAVLCDLPLILDDTKRAKHPAEIANVLYTVASGRGRGRGTVGGLATVRSWRTVLLSSGEQPITSFTNDGGTRMRVLEVAGTPFGAESVETGKIVNLLNLAVRANFGHAGPEFVRWLLQHRDQWAEWKREFQQRAAGYAESATSEKAGRLATYAAALAQTASLVHSALDLPWVFDDPLRSLWAEISAEADDAVGAKRALRLVSSWAHSNQNRFLGRELDVRQAPSGGWLGRWDRGDEYEWIAIYPNHLRDFLTAQKFDADSILTEWRDSGWLKVKKGEEKKRYTCQIRLGQSSYAAPMVCVLRSALESLDAYESAED